MKKNVFNAIINLDVTYRDSLGINNNLQNKFIEIKISNIYYKM